MKTKKITKKDIESFKKVLEFSFYNKTDIGKMLSSSDELEKSKLERIINTIEAYAKLHRDDGYNEAKRKYEDILFGHPSKRKKYNSNPNECAIPS